MACLKLAFDDGEFCCAVDYQSGLGIDYLEKKQFKENDLRGRWDWFRGQIPNNQDYSNVGILDMIGVQRDKQTRGFGRRALRLVTHLMRSEGVTVCFLEADPHMTICEDDYYAEYVAERSRFYASEGWIQLRSERHNPPRPHMWRDFSALVTEAPMGVRWEEASEEEFRHTMNLSDQEGYRPGT